MDVQSACGYVKKLFDENPLHQEQYGFRNKWEHTKRVCVWADRLLQSEEADREVVMTAALFHDVGYIYSGIGHPGYSAQICRRYLESVGCQRELIENVADIVANHQNKALLDRPGTSIEQILLIEADCLDESGAMSILRDALSEGLAGAESYEKVYQRLCERSIARNPAHFHCVTESAKRFWAEKQKLYLQFLDSLNKDLYGFEDVIREAEAYEMQSR